MSGPEPKPPFRPRFRPRPSAAVPHDDHGACRPGQPDEIHLESLRPDSFARLSLALMRWNFQTFAAPETQGWLSALRCATTHVGPRAAGRLCYDVVALVQVLRSARSSPFAFNPEGCARCRVWLTPDERRMMELLDAIRQGQIGRARACVQMLCDGVPDADLFAMAEVYLRRHAPDYSTSAGVAPAQTKGS